MEKDEVRAASVALRGLNFRLGKKFHEDLSGKMRLERQAATRRAAFLG